MNLYHWELSVLCRAIAYKNLSGAAANIGISQPQLSRIVSKLELDLKVVLLDRSSRRKSSWTATAFKLAETYSKGSRALETEIQNLVHQAEPTKLSIGTLEGLIPIATAFSRQLIRHTSLKQIELDVHDLSRLEELFLGGDLDLLFISREPGKKKSQNIIQLGYQSVNIANPQSKIEILSSFEFQTKNKRKDQSNEMVLISNSLEIRKRWIEKLKGSGTLPSKLFKTKADLEKPVPVYLLGSDLISPNLWKKIEKISSQELNQELKDNSET
jgi:hypothetical protein